MNSLEEPQPCPTPTSMTGDDSCSVLPLILIFLVVALAGFIAGLLAGSRFALTGGI